MTAPLREQFTNNPTTTLNGTFNSSVTTITVTSGAVFPATGNFRVICDNEIMLCTARSTNDLTVVRGYEGTTGASHNSGTTISQILTADGLDRGGKDNQALWGVSTRPPLNKLVAADGITLLTTSDFSWTNQGTASVSDLAGTIVLRAPSTAGNQFRIQRRTAPGTPWTLTAGLKLHVQGVDGGTINCQLGIIARQSTSGKFISLAVNRKSTDPQRFAIDHWTNETTYGGSTPFLGKNQIFHSDVIWMRINDNGTNLIFSVSDDGIEWIQLLSQSRSALMTLNGGVTGPDQIGFASNNGGDTTAPDALFRLLHWHVE
jgi:hypothetical protein